MEIQLGAVYKQDLEEYVFLRYECKMCKISIEQEIPHNKIALYL